MHLADRHATRWSSTGALHWIGKYRHRQPRYAAHCQSDVLIPPDDLRILHVERGDQYRLAQNVVLTGNSHCHECQFRESLGPRTVRWIDVKMNVAHRHICQQELSILIGGGLEICAIDTNKCSRNGSVPVVQNYSAEASVRRISGRYSAWGKSCG